MPVVLSDAGNAGQSTGDQEDVFDAMLGKDERNKDERVLMLQWVYVLFSVRPLTPKELCFGVTQLRGPWGSLPNHEPSHRKAHQ